MRILLVVPYQDIEPYILPNLGLGYLASALRNNGHDAVYLDCLKDKIDSGSWRGFLVKGKFDLIGIQMYSYTYSVVKRMFRIAKEVSPAVVTVAGGPHANAIPTQILENNPEIDYVIHGEGEEALPLLADAVQNNALDSIASIFNVAWRANGNVRVNPRQYIDNLDKIYQPAWDLMDPRNYPILSHGVLNRAYPIAPIFATRGCPYNCVFCSSKVNMGLKIRMRSPNKIVDEIDLLVKEYGVKEIHFEDDNLTFYKDFASEVCQGIIDRNIKVCWACPNGVRLDSLDATLLKLMERSGCYSVALGIESGSDRVLGLMKKNVRTDIYREKIKLIKDNTKIRMTGFFIFGFPGETEADIALSEKLILNEPFQRIAVGPFIPLPGTEIYNDLAKEKKVAERYDWNVLFPSGENIFLSGLIEKEKLLRYIRRIHLKFYLRPHIFFKILSEINSFGQLKVALRMFFLWLGIDIAKKRRLSKCE